MVCLRRAFERFRLAVGGLVPYIVFRELINKDINKLRWYNTFKSSILRFDEILVVALKPEHIDRFSRKVLAEHFICSPKSRNQTVEPMNGEIVPFLLRFIFHTLAMLPAASQKRNGRFVLAYAGGKA